MIWAGAFEYIDIYVAKTVDVIKIRNGDMSEMELIGTTIKPPYKGYQSDFELNPKRRARFIAFHDPVVDFMHFCSLTVT